MHKLMGLAAEQFIDHFLSSVNHIHKKDIEVAFKKINDAKADDKMPLKKFKMIKS
jgi:hypothetical protein